MQLIYSLTWKGDPFLRESYARKHLYELVSQIACKRKLQPNKKKQMIQHIKKLFRFNEDQELIDLYRSHIVIPADPSKKKDSKPKAFFFESKVL